MSTRGLRRSALAALFAACAIVPAPAAASSPSEKTAGLWQSPPATASEKTAGLWQSPPATASEKTAGLWQPAPDPASPGPIVSEKLAGLWAAPPVAERALATADAPFDWSAAGLGAAATLAAVALAAAVLFTVRGRGRVILP